MRQILIASAIALMLGSAAAAQNAVSGALGVPAQSKVAAPAPIAPTVNPGSGGAATTSTGNEHLDRVMEEMRQRGLTPLPSSNPDPEYQATLMEHSLHATELQMDVAQKWPRTSEAFDPKRITGILTLADGTQVPIGRSAGGQMVLQQFRPNVAANLSGGSFRIHPDDASIVVPFDLVSDAGAQTYLISSDGLQLTLNAAFLDNTGRRYLPPPINFPLAGGAQTVAIPGGGSLTVTLEPAPPRPAPTGPPILVSSPGQK